MAPPPSFDKRLFPIGPHHVAAKLQAFFPDLVPVTGQYGRVISPVAPLRKSANPAAGQESQAIYGEFILAYGPAISGPADTSWHWVQSCRDSYVGFIESRDISLSAFYEGSEAPQSPSPDHAPCYQITHWVSALRTPLFAKPDIKSPIHMLLERNSALAITGSEGRFLACEDGYVIAAHCVSSADRAGDFVGLAQSMLGVPYVWGGKSGLGFDCSGLVQHCLQACGLPAPRDTDQQEQTLGSPIAWADDPAALSRGDLLFWPGHVGIYDGKGQVIHANATAMAVTADPLPWLINHIQQQQGHPLRSIRRLSSF